MGKPSAFIRILRIVTTLALLAFLVVSPGWLIENLARDAPLELFTKPTPAWHGRIEIWHVAEFRVYQGSVTDYLQTRADAYCKGHPGVHIDVVGLTPKRYNDRLARGAFPDVYSFPSGLVYREQLQQMDLALPTFSGSLDAARADGNVYAVPYLMSGYLLAANDAALTGNRLVLPETPDEAALTALLQSAMDMDTKTPLVYAPPVVAARLGLTGELASTEDFMAGRTALSVVDARELGDALRSDKANLSLTVLPFVSYSSQVLYLGVAKDADAAKAAAAADFAAYLLTEPEQQRLSSLGALPVTTLETPPIYTEEALDSLAAAYFAPVVPEPFAYQRHREQLTADAWLALTGDPAGKAGFFERMQVVENGNL